MNRIFIKQNVELEEYYIHILARQIGLPTPRIIVYDSDSKQLTMEKIDGSNIADMYGAKSDNISENIWENIRQLIKKLYMEDIVYPDITGYNFIQDSNNKLWIIDFGHAYLRTDINRHSDEHEQFVIDLIDGINQYNPYFE
jgi:tRNA A-37 threonylcarbamoyl transferase component Bud32